MQIQGLLNDQLENPPVNILAGFVYDSSGNFFLGLILNKNFQLVFGANDFTARNGSQNFVPPPLGFFFTSTSSAFSMTGVPNALVTAALYQLT